MTFERFTDRARKVCQLAQQEAQRFNVEWIGTEHLLVGLAKEGSGVAANVLKNLGVDILSIRKEVEKRVQPGPEIWTTGRLPYMPGVKKIFEFAIQEAKDFGHNYVGTEHLLLGMLDEKEGIACQVLVSLGVSLERVREEVVLLISGSKWADQPVVVDAKTQEAIAELARGQMDKEKMVRYIKLFAISREMAAKLHTENGVSNKELATIGMFLTAMGRYGEE